MSRSSDWRAYPGAAKAGCWRRCHQPQASRATITTSTIWTSRPNSEAIPPRPPKSPPPNRRPKRPAPRKPAANPPNRPPPNNPRLKKPPPGRAAPGAEGWVAERCSGDMDGAVCVGAGVEKVRVPRLPELLPPPIRASAVLATSASAIVAAPNIARTRPNPVMDNLPEGPLGQILDAGNIGSKPAVGKRA